jgi:hypothetical protein
MSTPKVRQAAREYFDCPTLQGAELENQDVSCALLGTPHFPCFNVWNLCAKWVL